MGNFGANYYKQLKQWRIESLIKTIKELVIYALYTFISYLLYEQDELIHSQLFDAFLNNHLLQKEDKDQYVVNMQQTIHGIFVPLANCYSPSCRSNNLNCYSPLCPNKVFSDLLQLIDQEHVKQLSFVSFLVIVTLTYYNRYNKRTGYKTYHNI